MMNFTKKSLIYLRHLVAFCFIGAAGSLAVHAERIDNPNIVVGDFGDGWPEFLSDTGFFSDLESMTAAPGVLSYSPNVNFWSDHAIKSRWVYVPFGETITFSEEEDWAFPVGTIWVKHFDMAHVRADPSQGVLKMETRFLVKNRFGVYGVSYLWNEEGTDATLLDSAAYTFQFDVEIEGQATTLDWTVPSRSDCLTCHVSGAGFALSFNTQQLNKKIAFDGVLKNIITHLDDEEYFDGEIPDPSGLPYFSPADDETVSLDQRARSYLAVNCAYCHAPDGPLESNTWDSRSTIVLPDMDLIDEDPAENLDDDAVKLLVRGDSSKSLIWMRMGAASGTTRMPPLATTVIDDSGMNLIQRWIDESLVSYETFSEWIVSVFEDELDEAVIGRDADPDGDGDSNYLEYLSRTDPMDPNSKNRIEVVHGMSGTHLEFNASEFSDYRIESSSDLAEWSSLPMIDHSIRTLPEADDSIVLEIEPGSEDSFYRVNANER